MALGPALTRTVIVRLHHAGESPVVRRLLVIAGLAFTGWLLGGAQAYAEAEPVVPRALTGHADPADPHVRAEIADIARSLPAARPSGRTVRPPDRAEVSRVTNVLARVGTRIPLVARPREVVRVPLPLPSPRVPAVRDDLAFGPVVPPPADGAGPDVPWAPRQRAVSLGRQDRGVPSSGATARSGAPKGIAGPARGRARPKSPPLPGSRRPLVPDSGMLPRLPAPDGLGHLVPPGSPIRPVAPVLVPLPGAISLPLRTAADEPVQPPD